MELEELATLSFSDPASGDEAVVVVRAGRGQVALCISLAQNCDVEIVLGSGELKQLIDALQKAIPVMDGAHETG